MPSLRDLRDNQQFQALSPEARRIVVDRVAGQDEAFQQLSASAQAVVKARLSGAPGAEGDRPGFFQRAGRRLGEAAEAARRGVGAFLELTGGPEPGEPIPRLSELGRKALEVAGGVVSPVQAVTGVALGAPVETAAAAFLPEEQARTVGTIAEFGVPLFAAKLAQLGRATTGSGAAGKLARELLGVPEPIPEIPPARPAPAARPGVRPAPSAEAVAARPAQTPQVELPPPTGVVVTEGRPTPPPLPAPGKQLRLQGAPAGTPATELPPLTGVTRGEIFDRIQAIRKTTEDILSSKELGRVIIYDPEALAQGRKRPIGAVSGGGKTLDLVGEVFDEVAAVKDVPPGKLVEAIKRDKGNPTYLRLKQAVADQIAKEKAGEVPEQLARLAEAERAAQPPKAFREIEQDFPELGAEAARVEAPAVPRVPTSAEALAAPRPAQALGQAAEGAARPGMPQEVPVGAAPPPPRPPASAIAGAAESTPPPRLTDPILQLPRHRQVLDAAEDLFREARVSRDPNRLISDQVLDLLGAGKLDLSQLERVLAHHKIGFVEFGDTMFRPAIRDSARRLSALSVLERRIQALAQSPGARDELGRLLDLASEVDEGVRVSSWWRRADNIRRGLLVSQLGTAVRNFETQVGRVGLDVLDQGLQGALQRTFGFEQTAHATEGFEAALNILRGGKRLEVEQILRAFPREHDRLLMTYHADIRAAARQAGREAVLKPADRLLGKAERAVALLNTANRFQEFLVRRSVFMAKLGQQLKAKGKDLGRIIAENRVGAIPEADVRAAVDKALEVTWAAQPKHGTVAADFIRLVNKLPGATLAIPFPRFMMNSLRFFYEFSPAGLLQLLGPAERAALAAGNMRVLSRAALGTAMVGAAYEFRGSEFAGEKWYEARLPDGRTIDLRPFNPFAAYLFVGDVLRRTQEGTLFRLEAKDIAMGVLSANVRAGTGLFLVDKLLGGLTELGTPEKAARALKGLAGETVAGFLTPLQQLTDVMAEYDERLKTVRERRSEPFLGPLKARIPGQAETLPPVHLPTREAPLRREQPLARQLTGLIVGTRKNPLERELDRLQFNRQEILPSTGEPEADVLVATRMGELAEARLVPIVRSPVYRGLSEAERSLVLQRLLTEIRKAATSLAERENPEAFLKVRLGRIPARTRPLVGPALRQLEGRP